MNILIDIIEEKFTEYLTSHLSEKLSLPILILKALEDSLQQRFHQSDILKFRIYKPEQLCAFYIKPASLHELSETGLEIPYMKIEIWTPPTIQDINLMSPVCVQYLDFKYTDTYSIKYQIKKLAQKTKNKFTIEIKTFFIPANIFENIFIKLAHLCNSGCDTRYLQETKLEDSHYVSGSIFECKICGKKFACTCCQKGILEYITQTKDKSNYLNDPCIDYNYPFEIKKITLLENLHYLPNICHICTQQIPFFHNYSFATSTFASKYYPYIENMAFQKGAKRFEINQAAIWREAENCIREKMNYPKIGEKWINETFLYNILKNLFADYQIIREASPSFLGKLRLDFFIPELSLAIEYQGEQHFHPVQRFGGEESFVAGKQRDLTKQKLCKKNSITLVYFNYFEELDESLVERKLKKFIKK